MANNVFVSTGSPKYYDKIDQPINFVQTPTNQELDANNAVRSTFDTGRKSSIGTSVVQLTTVSTPAVGGVLVLADSSNSGVVYVGSRANITADSSDTTDGFPLSAGKAVLIPVDNANKVFLVGSASSQKVWWEIT